MPSQLEAFFPAHRSFFGSQQEAEENRRTDRFSDEEDSSALCLTHRDPDQEAQEKIRIADSEVNKAR